jgi:hypothetical protein
MADPAVGHRVADVETKVFHRPRDVVDATSTRR